MLASEMLFARTWHEVFGLSSRHRHHTILMSLHACTGGYHELLQGPEKEDAVHFISEWILSHSGPQVEFALRVL